MLGVLPDSISDNVNKSLGFARALATKGLKSLPADRNSSLVLYLILVLLLAEHGGDFEEDSHIRNSVWACGTGGGKVIFAQLDEIVTL